MVHPTPFRRSGTFLALVGLFLASLALLPSFYTPASASAASDAESQFLTKLNQERTSRGLHALVFDARYAATARDWSGHMSATNTLAHDGGLAADASSVSPHWRALRANARHRRSARRPPGGLK